MNKDKDEIQKSPQNKPKLAGSNINIPVTCLWEKVAVRESPQEKGKYITSMHLGEIATYLNKEETDQMSSKNRVYLKIELTDGKIGWIQKRFLGLNVKPASIIKKTKLYKRPDILTVTNKVLDRIQFIAVTEEKGEWVKVKGKRNDDSWFSEGWIKKDKLTFKESDVTVSILAQKAASSKTPEKSYTEILKNSELKGSTFIADIHEILGINPIDRINGDINGLLTCWLSSATLNPRLSESEKKNNVKPKGYSIKGEEYFMYTAGINGLFYDYYSSGLISCMNDISLSGRNNYDLKNSVSDYCNGLNVYDKEFIFDYNSGKSITENKFNYINPTIIKWATQNLIPHPESEILGKKAIVIYQVIFSRFFRMMTTGYLYSNRKMDIYSASQKYLNAMQVDKFDGIVYLETNYRNSFNEQKTKQMYYDELQDFMVIGFWLRRHIDGSIDEVWKGLEKGMLLYDKEWLTREKIDFNVY